LKTNGFTQPGHGIFPSLFDLFFSNAGLALEQTSGAAAREAQGGVHEQDATRVKAPPQPKQFLTRVSPKLQERT